MQLWKLIILAIIQGISEILPISSSGHLILFKEILNINYSGLDLEIFLHFGSLIAVIFFYKKELILIIKDFFSYLLKKEKSPYKNNYNLSLCLLTSTLITGVFGLLLNNIIESYLSNILILPFSFLFTSLLLFISLHIKEKKNLNSIKIKDSIIIGLIQILGLIPGVSRSGSTIVGGKFTKLDYSSSTKYSYLLFIPITLSSFLLKLIDFINEPVLLFPISYYLISLLIVALFTYLSLIFFTNKINNKSIKYFSYYLLILSLVIVYFFYI